MSDGPGPGAKGAHRGLHVRADVAAFVAAGGRDVPLGTLSGLEPGRSYRLLDPKGAGLGVAIADPENERLRLFATPEEGAPPLDGAFFERRVARARALRRGLGLDGAYRLVHGAGDGLPGLACDVYGAFAVVYAYARALLPWGRALAAAVVAQAGARGVVLKVRSRGAGPRHSVEQEVVGEAPPEAFVALERGLAFEVHLHAGLNVGLFTDMREQRQRIATMAAGRRVLNGFSYTSSLSVAAAQGGAVEVTSVDLSSGVLAWAQDNFRHNGLDPAAHRFEADDVGRFLARAAEAGRRYELVLLDPPTFSAARGAKWTIEKDYPALIAQACAVLAPDGLLWLASNTRGVALGKLAEAGLGRARRRAELLHVGGAGPDFPTVLAQPEDRHLQVGLYRVT